MIIDFHVHCFPDELAKKAVPALSEYANVPAKLDGTVDSLKKSMEISGIDSSVVLSIATKPSQTEIITNWSAGIQDDKIIAFASIHPEYGGWRHELERIRELGIKGIKYHPDYQQFYIDDKKILPVYERAFELGLIIIFHAGVDIGLPPPQHCTPDRLLKLVRAFPGAKIVAAHMGSYFYWNDVEKLLVGKDIYFDTSYSIGWIKEEQMKRIINGHDYRKILFATDSPWTDQAEEIAKFKALNLDHTVEAAILYENAKNILDI